MQYITKANPPNSLSGNYPKFPTTSRILRLKGRQWFEIFPTYQWWLQFFSATYPFRLTHNPSL